MVQQTQMVASTTLPFAAEKFGDVYSSPGPNKPNIKRVVAFFTVFGFGLGIFIVFFRFAIYRVFND